MITTNIIINKSALSGIDFKESIDLALVCAAFDHQVNVIFIGNGIYNLVVNQSYEGLRDKNHLDILKGLKFYDIENVFVEQESLLNNVLQNAELLPSVQVKTRSELRQLNLTADHLVTL